MKEKIKEIALSIGITLTDKEVLFAHATVKSWLQDKHPALLQEMVDDRHAFDWLNERLDGQVSNYIGHLVYSCIDNRIEKLEPTTTQQPLVDEFNPDEWSFERSSGYAGERNSRTGEWIFEDEYNKRRAAWKERLAWEEVFRIIKLRTRSNFETHNIVEDLKEKINIFVK